ncbi:MAG: SIS domain-containing protein [Cyclobacteriaceae bacterium]|nr:MAG: SIS domain-containing protein [Cyclobacteriaceae bacterium]
MNIAKNIKNIAREVLLNESRAIENLSALLDNDFEECVKEIYSSKGRVVITGIGKSGHMANKIVMTPNASGLPTIFKHSSTSINTCPALTQQDDIVACISESGTTSEIKVLVPIFKRSNMKVVVCGSVTKTRLVSQDRKSICCKQFSAYYRFYSQPDLVKERIA